MANWFYKEIFLPAIRFLPLVGGLADCRRRDHREGLPEFCITTFLSTTPIWLGSFIVFAGKKQIEKNVQNLSLVFKESIYEGELLLYSTAVLAPIFYLTLRDDTNGRGFPRRLSVVVCSILTMLIAAGLFSAGISGQWLDPQIVFPTSLATYGFALVIFYLTLIYRNLRLTGASDATARATQEFVDHVSTRRK